MTKSVGALTFAFGTAYQRLALGLALSLRLHEIPLTVVVSSADEALPELLEVADKVIPISGRFAKFEYEALAYDLSPYDVTLKMDADMIVPKGVFMTELIPMIVGFGILSGGACKLSGERNHSTEYRKIEAEIGLPTVYSALFGFTKNEMAAGFFNRVKQLFRDWYGLKLFSKDLPPTTDTVYSIAWASEVRRGLEPFLPFVHMKYGIVGHALPLNWANSFPHSVSDDGSLYVGVHKIRLPFHYFDKEFLTDQFLEQYRNVLAY